MKRIWAAARAGKSNCSHIRRFTSSTVSDVSTSRHFRPPRSRATRLINIG